MWFMKETYLGLKSEVRQYDCPNSFSAKFELSLQFSSTCLGMKRAEESCWPMPKLFYVIKGMLVLE